MQLSQALLRYAAVGGPQHILMCKAVGGEQSVTYDARVGGCWERVLGITFIDGSWSRASLPLKLGGIAPGTVGDRASAAYISATTRTLSEVMRGTDMGGVTALRQAAPGFDRRITGATADLSTRGLRR